MERLTFEGNFCDIAKCAETPGGSHCEDGACSQRKVWERLKAYEDTGMEPEQIRDAQETLRCFDNIGIKRGNEIVTAEEEGRLVILPCKVGDTVYFLLEDLPVYYPETNGWYISTEEITAVCTHGFFTGPIEQIDSHSIYSFDDLGKTVFLTREEAEAALKGGAAK